LADIAWEEELDAIKETKRRQLARRPITSVLALVNILCDALQLGHFNFDWWISLTPRNLMLRAMRNVAAQSGNPISENRIATAHSN
jgi:hypothetical protein